MSTHLFNLSNLNWVDNDTILELDDWKKDANTKYFDGCINKRSRENGIITLEGNNKRLNEVVEIKKTIIEHFQNHFTARNYRTYPTNINFKIHGAVWDYKSSKNLGLDRLKCMFNKRIKTQLDKFWYFNFNFFKIENHMI